MENKKLIILLILLSISCFIIGKRYNSYEPNHEELKNYCIQKNFSDCIIDKWCMFCNSESIEVGCVPFNDKINICDGMLFRPKYRFDDIRIWGKIFLLASLLFALCGLILCIFFR